VAHADLCVLCGPPQGEDTRPIAQHSFRFAAAVLRLFKIMNILENFTILASRLAFERKRLVGTRRRLE
jgi:hypothetical protein